MPTDNNIAGDIFGGWIMSQVDIAASIAAFRRAKGRVVTVAVNSFEFHRPVFVGDLISCYAEDVRIGRTSLTVDVEDNTERKHQNEECIKVSQATKTKKKKDEQHKPRVVPRGETDPAYWSFYLHLRDSIFLCDVVGQSSKSCAGSGHVFALR